jgi:hypothetical protein
VHVAQQRQRLSCQDAWVRVGGAWTHQQTLRHLQEAYRESAACRVMCAEFNWRSAAVYSGSDKFGREWSLQGVLRLKQLGRCVELPHAL